MVKKSIEVKGFIAGATQTQTAIPKTKVLEEEKNIENTPKKKSNAGRKSAGAKVDIRVSGKTLRVKKIQDKPKKINKSYYLEEEYINIVERRAKEIGITPSQLIQESIKLMDNNIIIED